MNIERLAAMANDIARFFHAEPDHAVAVDGISGHIRRYWEPRMRKQVIAYAKSDSHDELSELAHEGILRLASMDASHG